MSRAFCIPPETVQASPHAERILLFFVAAMMESFAIGVQVCADPEYAAVEGFVLERSRQAIEANWVGADGIWQVGATADRPAVHDYGEIVAYPHARTVVPGQSSGQRLRALADYLQLDWPWLVRRCSELGDYGRTGIVEPRGAHVAPMNGGDHRTRCVEPVLGAVGLVLFRG